jgi:hypothetical protein
MGRALAKPINLSRGDGFRSQIGRGPIRPLYPSYTIDFMEALV